MMKIALPTRQNTIDQHFGHCESFTVFSLNDEHAILSQENVPSPAGCGCRSNIAATLSELGVTLMLAGNMGEGAVGVLKSHGIDVVRGCAGETKAVVEGWIKGSIEDSGANCAHHHSGDCETHHAV